MINLDAIASGELKEAPFKWAFFDRSFESIETASALSESFPATGYIDYDRHSTAKKYRTRGRFLIKMGYREVFRPEELSQEWIQFANEILSDEYLDAVSALLSERVHDTNIEVVFWRLPEGSTIDPHLDNSLKVASHLFYFNKTWTEEQGGYFRILNSWDLSDVHKEFAPILNSSIIFRRSSESWHGYPPVKGGVERLAVQVSFCGCAAYGASIR